MRRAAPSASGRPLVAATTEGTVTSGDLEPLIVIRANDAVERSRI